MSNEAQTWALSLPAVLSNGRILKSWPKAVLVRLADYADVDHGIVVGSVLANLIASELLIDESRVWRALNQLTRLRLIERHDCANRGSSGGPQPNSYVLKVANGVPWAQTQALLKKEDTK